MNEQITKYKFLHELHAKGNYLCDDFESGSLIDKEQMGNIIHDDYSTMTDEEKRILVAKLLPIEKVNKELLLFDLKYYKPTKIDDMTLEEFSKKAL